MQGTDMVVGWGITPPHEGELLKGIDLAYVKRRSAEFQADMWNLVLADDPVLGPASGLVVGVRPKMDGRYPLVWVRRGALTHDHPGSGAAS